MLYNHDAKKYTLIYPWEIKFICNNQASLQAHLPLFHDRGLWITPISEGNRIKDFKIFDFECIRELVLWVLLREFWNWGFSKLSIYRRRVKIECTTNKKQYIKTKPVQNYLLRGLIRNFEMDKSQYQCS